MGGKLGCDFTGCVKRLIIQCFEILTHGAWRVIGISFSGRPVFGGAGILVLNISGDQAGIHHEAAAANQSLFLAARNDHLEHMAQQITVAETTVHCPAGDCEAICREGRFLEKVE